MKMVYLRMKSQQRFKGESHSVYTEEVNRIVLSSNGDYKLLIELQHIHMEQMLLKYVEARC